MNRTFGSVPRTVMRIWRTGGYHEVLRKGSLKVARQLSDRFAWPDLQFMLRPEDITDSVSVLAQPRLTNRPAPTDRLRVGFVCLPPAGGSGGHTTLFRMIKSVQNRGHECTVFLYDRDNEDVERHAEVLRRNWPWLTASIRPARPFIDGVDAVVASSWEMAHVVACRTDPAIPRYYFVQDYEPYFFPQGPLWALAEDTYRFGFKIIALGDMVAFCIQTQVGVTPRATVPFGCDTDTYRLLESSESAPERSGVVLYAKTNADRRGYWLARHALHQFHRDHPEQPIHIVGDRVSGWTIPVIQHGSVTPHELNEIYNRTIAGLALSFTNITLVAEEMLAAGTIAVANDSPLARLGLRHQEVIWAPATPQGIADALGAAVDAPDRRKRAVRAAAELGCSWDETGAQLARVIEDDAPAETMSVATVAGSSKE